MKIGITTHQRLGSTRPVSLLSAHAQVYCSRERLPFDGVVQRQWDSVSPAPRRVKGNVKAVTDASLSTPAEKVEKDLRSVVYSEDETAAVTDTFDWFKQWYIVAVADFIDDSRPYPIELLGMPLVLWKDGTDTWRCFENMCPHRLAPLSEGRTEPDGNLLCSYHAWRFNGDGKCVALPQAKDEKTFQEIVRHPRACVKTYPVKVLQGAIWVWADSSPTAFIDCQVREPAIIPEIDQELPPGWERTRVGWMDRDLPYGWDFTHENVMDRAHLAISHHNVTGNRYEDAYFMDTSVKVGPTLQDGFKSSLKTLPKGAVSVHANYEPPCLWKVVMTLENGAQDFVILYSTPKKPGVTHWVGNHFMIRPKGKKTIGSGFAKSILPTTEWMRHTFITTFIHQDVAFLHYQERFIAKFKEGKSLHERYWMPCPQDKDVIVFRKWVERAGGGVPYVGYEPGYVPPLLSEDEMFDFYESHAKRCRICQAAMKGLTAFRVALWAGCAFAFMKSMIIAALRPSASLLPPAGSLLFGALGLFCALLAWGVSAYLTLFRVYKYSHQDND